ncbi:MAG TPA: thiamine pyrophosphate-binding protein [Bacillota bacterium]
MAEAVAQALAAEQVDVVFGLMAEDNIDLFLHLAQQPGIKLIFTRHEQGAVTMADGYARISGRPGVCLVGRGPAIAQTGTGLVTARKRPSPVVVLVPLHSITELYSNKQFEQEAFLRATVGNVITIRSPRTVAEDLQRAFRHARLTGEPVAVQVPIDFFPESVGTGWRYEPQPAILPQRVQPDA